MIAVPANIRPVTNSPRTRTAKPVANTGAVDVRPAVSPGPINRTLIVCSVMDSDGTISPAKANHAMPGENKLAGSRNSGAHRNNSTKVVLTLTIVPVRTSIWSSATCWVWLEKAKTKLVAKAIRETSNVDSVTSEFPQLSNLPAYVYKI